MLFAAFLSVSPKERVQLHGVWVACFHWFFFTFFSFLPYVYTYFFLLFHTADSFFVAHTTRFGVQLAVLLFVRIISYHPLLWYPGDKKNDIGLRSRKKDTWCWVDFGN